MVFRRQCPYERRSYNRKRSSPFLLKIELYRHFFYLIITVKCHNRLFTVAHSAYVINKFVHYLTNERTLINNLNISHILKTFIIVYLYHNYFRPVTRDKNNLNTKYFKMYKLIINSSVKILNK